MMILYHNNRCSKSRAALAWLTENHVPIEVVDYQTQSLNETQLRQLAKQLNLASVREMMRVKDDLFTQLHLASASEDELFAALASHPQLLERPILVCGARAAIGRPLSNIQDLLK